MRRLQAAHGLTYIVISHDLSVVRYLADRIGVMYLGKLVEVGSSADVYERTVHPYTHGLLATIPVPDPGVERAKHTIAVAGELPSAMDPPSGCRFRPGARGRGDLRRAGAGAGPLRRRPPGACHFPLQVPEARSAVARLPALQPDVQ